MLSAGREGLFQLGLQQQHQGQNQAAMHCFLSSLQGLTHVQNFPSLPNCLHQIAELFITEKNYGKALQFIQAEKMFYEVALIELTALQANTGSREGGALGPEGWVSQEDLCEQAAQAQDLERLAQLCIMTNRPHLALEYCGKATKIHQRAFGSEHPVTTRSLELLATVYAEIGKTEYSDSLRECVSTLPKSFPPCEAYSAKPSSATHTHPERHHELRHRKDPGSQPETPSQRVSGGAKAPTSILKRYGEGGAEADPPQRPRRGGRRVRFREPETTVHVYDSAQRRPPLAVLTCLFLLLSALGVALYCAGRRRPQRVCEELRTSLALCLLQLRQLLWGCWVWFTMQ